MKKLIVLMFILTNAVTLLAKTHTVVRGESLQSIAAKYNITTTQLVKANPGADNLFYVGLKLNIPENEATTPETNVSNQSTPSAYTIMSKQQAEVQYNQSDMGNDDNPGIESTVMIEYGFLDVEGMSGCYTYAVSVGANYYFMHKNSGLFAGARIGYNSASISNSFRQDGYSQTVEYKSHFISVPVNFGYSLTTSDKNFGITPYAGIDANFCVAGKNKQEIRYSGMTTKDESKLKKKVGLDARVGLQLRLWGFNIGGSYVMPLNQNQEYYFGEDSYFAINIGFGF